MHLVGWQVPADDVADRNEDLMGMPEQAAVVSAKGTVPGDILDGASGTDVFKNLKLVGLVDVTGGGAGNFDQAREMMRQVATERRGIGLFLTEEDGTDGVEQFFAMDRSEKF
jgi:hypothetical protein